MDPAALLAQRLRLLHGALRLGAAAPGWEGRSAEAYREQLEGAAALLVRAVQALEESAARPW